MTNAASAHGLVAIFRTWQTYAMVAAGGFTLFLLQSALNAGPLVAAQPGLTAANPVLAFLWGVLVFGGESVRSGFYLLLAPPRPGWLGGRCSDSRTPRCSPATTRTAMAMAMARSMPATTALRR